MITTMLKYASTSLSYHRCRSIYKVSLKHNFYNKTCCKCTREDANEEDLSYFRPLPCTLADPGPLNFGYSVSVTNLFQVHYRFTAHLPPHVAIKFRRDITASFYALESSKAVSHGILLRRGLEYAADRDASCTSSFGDGQLRTNQKRYQICMNSNSICSTVSIGHLRVSHIRISMDSTR